MADPQVQFDYATWVARYPELASVPEATAQLYFDEAGLYWRNDGTGPEADDAVQLRLMNMLTAHIAKLSYPLGGSPASPLVGPVTSASEGSVSVSVQPLQAPGTQAWYVTTVYGAQFWAATAAYRTARYVPGPQRRFNPPWVQPLFRR